MYHKIENNKDYIKFSESSNLSDSQQEVDNSSSEAFSVVEGVKVRKNKALKTRLRTLIHEREMSEAEFRDSIGMSRQHWYAISWAIWPCPIEWKLKIARALGVDSALIWGGKNE